MWEKVDFKNSDFVHLLKQIPDIGLSVCVSGYPLAVITANSQGGLELGGVRRYFQPSFVLDKCKVNCDNGAGKKRTHDGFLVRDFGLFGMSGGPIVDKKGVVVGMQGSVTQPRVSSNGQRAITVENAIAIRSNLIIDFLAKNKIDIPK